MSIKDKKVGFLGSGNMGEAIIKGLLQTGLVPASTDRPRKRCARSRSARGCQSRRSSGAPSASISRR